MRATKNLYHIHHDGLSPSTYTKEELDAERKRIVEDPDGYMEWLDEQISLTIDKWIDSCGEDHLLTSNRSSYLRI